MNASVTQAHDFSIKHGVLMKRHLPDNEIDTIFEKVFKLARDGWTPRVMHVSIEAEDDLHELVDMSLGLRWDGLQVKVVVNRYLAPHRVAVELVRAMPAGVPTEHRSGAFVAARSVR